jgi:hypothetical protein
MTTQAPKPKTTKSNVVRMSRARAMTREEVWEWIKVRHSIGAPATVMCREWGWPARRAQRQITKWVLAGKLYKHKGVLTVAGLPATPHGSSTSTASGVRKTLNLASLRVLIAGAILTPIAALNMWPRIEQLISGRMDSAGWAIAAFQLLAMLLLAQIPFVMSRVRSWPPRIVLSGFATLLICGNMVFAVEAIGTVRDAARDRNRSLTGNITSLNRQMVTARADRAALGTVTPVTPNEVLAAAMAVQAAQTAREAECGKVGDNCRKREDNLRDAQAERARVESAKAISDKATALDASVSDLEGKLRTLGPAPLAQDPIAARLSLLTFGLMTAEQTADAVPNLLSLIAELVALLGPWIVMSAFQPAPPDERRSRR